MAKYKVIGTFNYTDLDLMNGVYNFEVITVYDNQTYLLVVTTYFENLTTLATVFEKNFPKANITSVTKC